MKLIIPFIEYDFLLRALLLGVVNAIGLAPSGVFLVNKKMSLIGDSFSHAILPGIAIAYYYYGLSYPMMILGGIVVALILSAAFVFLNKTEIAEEDSFLATTFVFSMALGIFLISMAKNKLDLFHVLFGTILSASNQSILLVGLSSLSCVLFFSLFWKMIVFESVDYLYMKNKGINTNLLRFIFFFVVYQNLVFTFVNMGTLLGFGFLVMPQAIARAFTRNLKKQIVISFVCSSLGVYMGLLISFQFPVPVGASIIIILGIILFFISIIKKTWRKYA